MIIDRSYIRDQELHENVINSFIAHVHGSRCSFQTGLWLAVLDWMLFPISSGGLAPPIDNPKLER